MGEISKTYLFANGMVMTFDERGEQMSEYQGCADEVADRICRDAGSDVEFHHAHWREGWDNVMSKEAWLERAQSSDITAKLEADRASGSASSEVPGARSDLT